MSTKALDPALQPLEEAVVVLLDFHTWKGSGKLRSDDVGINKSLPKEVFSLGSKYYIDRKRPQVFETLVKRAQRLSLRYGTRFIGGYLIGRDILDQYVAELDGIIEEFNEEKEKLRSDYDDEVRAQIDRHPEFANALREAARPVEDVMRTLSASYQLIEVRPGEAPQTVKHENLIQRVQELGGGMYREIAAEAMEYWSESLKNRDKIKSRRSLNRLRMIRDKLTGLAFLDGSAMGVANRIDFVLDGLPKTGAIENEDLAAIKALVVALSDPEKARRLGSRPQAMSQPSQKAEDNDEQMDEQEAPEREDEQAPASVTW